MAFWGYVFVIFFVGISIILFVAKGILFYNRNLRTYKDEIRVWLQSQSFVLVDTRYPTDKDWINSPFLKPSSIDSPFNYMPNSSMKYRDKSYLIIIGTNQKIFKEFWMEIDSEFGNEPTLNFRVGKEIKPNEKTYPQNKINYIKVVDTCPACLCKLNKEEKICPECGLCFE